MNANEQLTGLMKIILDAQEALKACGYNAPPNEPLCESIRNIAAGRRGWRQLYEEVYSYRRELLCLLRRALSAAGDAPCRPDHHGNCQEHDLEPIENCWVAQARRIMI